MSHGRTKSEKDNIKSRIARQGLSENYKAKRHDTMEVMKSEGLALSTPPACMMLLMGGSQPGMASAITALASALEEMSHMASLKQPCSPSFSSAQAVSGNAQCSVCDWS